jgi:purine-binding chemotaxis protein CheW
MGPESHTKGAGFAAEVNQYLTFVLGPEEYGIDILKVQEIRGYSAITAIPNTPQYIKGVMNLRGAVVPVVDLRSRFGMPVSQYDKFTVIIVVMVGTRILGLVVDAVSDVLNIPRDAIEPPPELTGSIDRSFITGLGKAGDKLILLPDVDRLINPVDMNVLAPAA